MFSAFWGAGEIRGLRFAGSRSRIESASEQFARPFVFILDRLVVRFIVQFLVQFFVQFLINFFLVAIWHKYKEETIGRGIGLSITKTSEDTSADNLHHLLDLQKQ